MPKYTILIYESEEYYANMAPEGLAAVMDAHGAFAKAVVDVGAQIVGGEALKDTETATSIRGGVITDGPFFETKEVLGGYYLIEARDLDHAVEIAKGCPAAGGGVEVRPVMEFD